jgi:hypothetical protein
MQVQVSGHDQETAQRVRLALEPLCHELERHHEQSECRLHLAPGVVVAAFYARDGTKAQIPVGVGSLAAAMTVGPETLRKYVDQMIRWACSEQERSRIHHDLGLVLPGVHG